MWSRTSRYNWRFKLLSLVFVVLDTVPRYTNGEVKIKCSNADEFYYASPDSQCTSYYKCNTHGQREVKQCGLGSMFDFYTQICTRSSVTCYDPNCTGRPNGVFQDTTHACRRSFTCHSGQLVNIDNCPPKHLHNGSRCVSKDLVKCVLPQDTDDRRCEGKQDGLQAVNNCREYIHCQNGEVKDVKHCSDKYLFNVESKKCTPERYVTECPVENELSTELICNDKKDGPHIDPSSIDCTTYVICKNGKYLAHQQCAQQAVFDGSSCVPSILFSCQSRAELKLSKNVCRGKLNGLYTSPQNGCSFYVRCIGERVVEINQCQLGLYFDPEEQSCVAEKYLDRRKCIEKGLSQLCSGRPNGFYSESGCESYYFCNDGFKTQYKCSNGKLFNGEKCVPKTQFSCNLGVDEFCFNRPDGYYRDASGGCRSYHYCSNGHKITYICEEGHIFDGQKCVRPGRSNQCQQDFICYGKSDGYHPDVRSNCRNYVFCKNFEKITQLTCRDGNVFNGQKCVSPSEYACPSLYNYQQINCMPRQCLEQCANDGFFPDIDSGCRKYFFCIGGKATSLSCPTGKRFNGEICVTEDKFTCPVYCDTTSSTGPTICPLGGFLK